MDTLIPTSAELSGDQAVITRARSLKPAVQAASAETESTRRLSPALLDLLHGQNLFRLLLPKSSNGIETDPLTFFHVIDRLVPQPGRRLLDVGGLSRPAGGAGDLR